MKNEREYINLFSQKINIIGLTDTEMHILGKWHNNEKHTTKKITEFHKMKGKSNFEKLLSKIKIFPKNLKIEIIKAEAYNNGFDFKCKDIHGKNILIHFFCGGDYAGSAPHLTIITPDKIKDFYIGYTRIHNIFVPSIEQKFIIDPKREETLRNKYNENFNIKTNNNENNSENKLDTMRDNKKIKKNDFLTKEMVDKYYSNETEIIEKEQKGLKM